MDAATLMGIYGLGQDQNQDNAFGGMPLQRNAMAASLMGGLGKPARSTAEGAGQIGNALVAALLMNPKMAEQIGNGFGNWFNGYSWDGMARGSNLDSLNQQALSNIAGGAAGL